MQKKIAFSGRIMTNWIGRYGISLRTIQSRWLPTVYLASSALFLATWMRHARVMRIFFRHQVRMAILIQRFFRVVRKVMILMMCFNARQLQANAHNLQKHQAEARKHAVNQACLRIRKVSVGSCLHFLKDFNRKLLLAVLVSLQTAASWIQEAKCNEHYQTIS